MKIIRTLILFAFMFSAMSVFTQQALASDDLSAIHAIKGKVDAILGVLNTPEFKGDEKKEVRRQKIRDIVLSGFDFGRMAQSSLGKHWRGRTPEEKQAVLDDFKVASDWAKDHKRPLYLGEFGVYKIADMDSRVAWFQFVVEQAEKNNWSWGIWNLMGSSFGIYDLFVERYMRISD